MCDNQPTTLQIVYIFYKNLLMSMIHDHILNIKKLEVWNKWLHKINYEALEEIPVISAEV